MMFKIVTTLDARDKVVGTIWADGEHQAAVLAASIFGSGGEVDGTMIRVHRGEHTEIPLRVAEPAVTSPYLS